MDHIECPLNELWNRRRQWFEKLFNTEERMGSYLVSEYALGLLIDLQVVYCAGAFISSLILVCTIADAHLQDVEGAEGGMSAVFRNSEHQPDLEWLRRQRNRLVHYKKNIAPSISVDNQWVNRPSHEKDAKKAIRFLAKVIFERPGT